LHVRIELLWETFTSLLGVKESDGLPIHIHFHFIFDLTQCRGVFSTIAANLWTKGWRHVYHLLFREPFGLSLERTLQVGSSSWFLFSLATFLLYWRCTLVQNADAFWLVPMVGSSDTDM
jgi:hypothetical protein